MPRPKGSKNKPKDTTMAAKTGTEIATVDHAPQSKMMLLDYMADKYSLNPDEFSRTVRAVCGMPTATPEQFAAFLLVAKTYDLNPLIKEIYAFPAKGGGIVPIVSIDGWVNLVNSNPACDGYQFEAEHTDDGKLVSYTCTMYRKDRKYPVNVTEYLSECKRATDPWKMEHRMLRHKSMIQAARYAFGFAGIYDPDEGEKIAAGETDGGPPRRTAQTPPKQIEGTANPPADAPRSTAPDPEPGQDHAAGEVQDATPPRRAAVPPKESKPDPITSGPQPRAAASPKTKEVAPFKIPGTGETVETWSEKYIDNIKTSPDMAVLYKWIDVNADPLARLAKLNPSISLKVKQATEHVREELRDAQAKAQAKATAKAKPAAPPPSEMDDGPADGEMEESLGDAPATDYGKPADDNPETILKWIDATLATVSDPENLEEIWVQHCEPKILDMFPPDKSEAQAVYDRHEKRLGMD